VAGDVVFFQQVGQDRFDPQGPNGLQVVLYGRGALRGVTPQHAG
jgi:hypothetical protein